MTCLPDTVRQNSKLISIFAELSAKKHGIMQTVERMAEPEMREAMQRPDAGTIPKGASKTVKGTVIYHSPVGDIQLDWEDGAVTALKNAGADAKAGAPNELTELVFRQLDEYFAGTRKTFDFPYRVHGTPFQEAVWAALREPSDTRRPSGRWAWRITPIPSSSPSPATASLGRAVPLWATAAGWA